MKILDRIKQRLTLPEDNEALRTKKMATIPLLLIGALFTMVNMLAYFSRGLDEAGRIYILWTLFVLLAALFIWIFPRLWLPTLYAVITGTMVTALGTSVYAGGFQSGLMAIIWMLLGPISVALLDSVRAAVLVIILYIFGVIIAIFLEPFALSIAPDLTLNTRMQITAGNMIMMGLFAFAAVLYLMREVERYRQRADRLLLNVLPVSIAARLKVREETIADAFDCVSVLFADIVGFTTLSEKMTPQETVDLINEIFTYYDGLAEKYGVEKLRTIGDGYMVAAGVPLPKDDHAQALAAMALDMQVYMKRREAAGAVPLQVRIGINSGPAVAGIVGTTKFHYDLWGDMVNIASRLESQGQPGKVQIARPTYELIKNHFHCEPRGILEVKGKGEMETWFVSGARIGLTERVV